MRQPLVFLAALLVFLPSPLCAQTLSVYGTVTTVHASNVYSGIQFSSPGGTQYTGFWAAGVGGGVTVNVVRLPVGSLGFDLRGSVEPGPKGGNTALAGVKFGFHLPDSRLKPYAQASVGLLTTRTQDQSVIVNTAPSGYMTVTSYSGEVTSHYIAFEGLGGIDYGINPVVDYRIIEVGVGSGHRTGFSSGENATFLTINTGIVVHF